VRGAALARLGRAPSTGRPPPRPPRPARSWPERRSRGPQPAVVRAPPPRAAARVPVSRVAPTASKCGSTGSCLWSDIPRPVNDRVTGKGGESVDVLVPTTVVYSGKQ